MRNSKAGLLAMMLAGMFGDPAGAQEARDMHLEDAGFIMRPARTEHQLARLKLLPPRQFVSRGKGAGRYYLFADPNGCQCVFVGDGKALQSYRDMRTRLPQVDNNLTAAGISTQEELIRATDEDTLSYEPDDILGVPF
jgi:hypothetical protein